MAVDDLVLGGAVLDEDERAEEVRRVRVGAGVLKVVDELFDVLRLPRVRALERRDGELVIGSEHFAQGFFRRADRHIDRHPSLIRLHRRCGILFSSLWEGVHRRFMDVTESPLP